MDWLDLLAVQGTLKSLLQHHSSKASILWRSAFFILQLSHPYMTTGRTIALTRQNLVDKVMSLLFNMLSRLVITFLRRSSVQLRNRVRLFAALRTAACQASLSITNSRSSPKPMSVESVMPSNHLILCRPFSPGPQSFPASVSFHMSHLFTWGGQSIGVSASTSVLPMNTQGWSPLGWTGWISLQSKGLSRVFSNTTVQKHQFFCTQLSSQSNSHIHTWPLEKP